MKKITLFIAGIFLSIALIAQTETRSLSSFDEISVATGIEATLVKSSENKVVITSDDVDMDKIVSEVKGDRLILKIKTNKWGWNMKRKKVEATVYYTDDIGYVSASSGAYVDAENVLSSDNMEIHSSSGARVDLAIESDKARIEASSGATIELTGTSSQVRAEASSGSSIKAKDLMSQKADADVSSGASIDLWVEKELVADASSGGSVKYKGSPSGVNIDKSSGGSVKKSN